MNFYNTLPDVEQPVDADEGPIIVPDSVILEETVLVDAKGIIAGPKTFQIHWKPLYVITLGVLITDCNKKKKTISR